jgi:hypothetical protein
MSKEILFQTKFIKPLTECYGQNRLPSIRVQKIWERMKALPEHLYGQIVDRIILNHDNFPGIQVILDTCSSVGHEYAKAEHEKLKKSLNCSRCRSQGVIVVNNVALRCTCQLGELLYPSYRQYAGQINQEEKSHTDSDGNYHFENGTHSSFVPKGSKSVRDVRVVVKDEKVLPFKKEQSDFKSLSFNDFTPTEGA